MDSYAGMRIFVSHPITEVVDRTWHERLFTLPWRPFIRTKTVVFPAAVPADACYRVGNDLHCGDRFYSQLKREVGKGTTIAVAAALLAGWAPFFDGMRVEPQSVKSELALSLRDYGIWREEHDRNTFPTDMPKAGEPYDSVTGNVIREPTQ